MPTLKLCNIARTTTIKEICCSVAVIMQFCFAGRRRDIVLEPNHSSSLRSSSLSSDPSVCAFLNRALARELISHKGGHAQDGLKIFWSDFSLNKQKAIAHQLIELSFCVWFKQYTVLLTW